MSASAGLPENLMGQDKNPFPGLRPFQAEEAHLFFGRERYIDTVIDKLIKHHFVSIVGNSGSGKSSLLRAGVIPKLEAQQNWIMVTMRPGKSPVEELNQTLAKISELKFSTTSAESLKILQQNELGLVQLLRNVIPPKQKLVLVVDQFEELFRFNKAHEETALQFVTLLLKAIQQADVPIYVIITLRSDFIGDCEQFMGLPEAINNGQFLIPRLKRDELQLSITGPIEYAGQRISPRLVQQLVKDVGTNPDQLPILQHVLMRTWDVWKAMNEPNSPIDIEHYERTGKMEKALSNHAEEAMLELKTDEQQGIAAILFKTLTVKESDNRGVRRPTSIAKIAAIANIDVSELVEVVNIFRKAERGFLMPPENIPITDTSMVDISHESLMRVWDRLSAWVDEEYESAIIYQRISASAQLYEKGLSGLWRDPDLQIALDWDQKNKVTEQWAEQYNQQFQLSKRFIAASLQQKQFMVAEKRRKRKVSNMLVLIALVTLSGLSIWAFSERYKAQSNEEMALSEKQNAQAQEAVAQEQKLKAEESAKHAERERQNAERQQRIAIQNEAEATHQKQNAIVASREADNQRKRAETEKVQAIQQRTTADSLRTVAMVSERNAYRLRILSVAQTLATKSLAIQKEENDDLKRLLALQAYQFNQTYKGKKFDVDIFQALYDANKGGGDGYKNSSHTDMVRSVVYSPDGLEIASAGSDGTLILSNAAHIEQNIKIMTKQNAILENICYHAEGKRVACLADKSTVLLFNKEGNVSMPIELKGLHTDMVTGLAWNKNELVTIGGDRTLKLTDVVSGKTTNTILLPAKPLCLIIRESTQIAYVGLDDGSVVAVSLPDQKVTVLYKSVAKPVTIALSEKAMMLAVGSNDGHIQLFSTTGSKAENVSLNHHVSTITSISFDKQGAKLVSASLDGKICLWDIAEPDSKPMIFKEHESWVWSVCFSPNGLLFCSGGKDKNVFNYIANEALLVRSIEPKVKRNLTRDEWKQYVGDDIPFEKTIAELK